LAIWLNNLAIMMTDKAESQ